MGPWSLVIIPLIIGAIIAITKGIKYIQDNFTLDGKIQKVNEALAEQEKNIQKLRNEYEQLQSTVDSLTSSFEELKDLTPGSPEYLLRLDLYEAKLKEIKDKYGDVFTIDETTGLPVIDQDKLNQSALAKIYGAEYLKEQQQQTLNPQIAQKALNAITEGPNYDKDTGQYMLNANGAEHYIDSTSYNRVAMAIQANLLEGKDAIDWEKNSEVEQI